VHRASAAALIAVVLAAAGCGGSSSSSSGTTPVAATTTAAPTVTSTVTDTVIAPTTTGTAATGTGALPPARPGTPFIASLTAAGHRPVAGEDWTFTVRAKNKDGTPAGGTVRALLLLNGKLYDTIGWYGFNGTFTHAVNFPLERKDLPLVFRAQVIANGGVKNLDYPIKVQ
jgi:hypothetical protein